MSMRGRRRRGVLVAAAVVATCAAIGAAGAQDVAVDVENFRPDRGVEVSRDGETIAVRWPISPTDAGRLVLNLNADGPLIASLGLAGSATERPRPLLEDADLLTLITVGERAGDEKKPAGMSVFNTFFDSPAQRQHHDHLTRLSIDAVRISGRDGRATIEIDRVDAGPFSGRIAIHVYAGSRLMHVETILKTERDRVAYLYDTGLVAQKPNWKAIVWTDSEGRLHRDQTPRHISRAAEVRHRAIAAECTGGSIAVFPPPHQFFFPRDFTDNQSTVWFGRGDQALGQKSGFGIRQSLAGGGAYVPWYNAPPGTEQHLGAFFAITRGNGEEALRDALQFTRGDRFATIPGRVNFTSHWHMAVTTAALAEIKAGKPRTVPDFVKMFKDMNVNIVHLAEFHGDGHPRDPGPIRLDEMRAMFDECARLSEPNLLFLPGEEANVHFRPHAGGDPGHWLYLFPKPVAWTMRRGPDQPFRALDPARGVVYHVGNGDDMLRLLKDEHGLAWTAHPRIKASTFAPDVYRRDDFYSSDVWLGAAWKAMPADLSRPKLGERVLDLFNDMANWGPHKYMPGEVDVFKIDHTHELYGHMNINYVKLDRIPKFGESWQPLLDALRGGRFFVTTGEVLLRDFTLGGLDSGATLDLAKTPTPELRVVLEWTFPPSFLEVISGDGAQVFRERVDLTSEEAFGSKTITLRPDLRGRRWLRVEAWDVAANGAFSQPVWIKPATTPR